MINQAILLGSLGADPEQRQTQNGNTVTNFNVATSRNGKVLMVKCKKKQSGIELLLLDD